MILLEPANKITHCNVAIKRRTISLTGFWETTAHWGLEDKVAENDFAGGSKSASDSVLDGVRQRASIGAFHRLRPLYRVIREICAPDFADSAGCGSLLKAGSGARIPLF